MWYVYILLCDEKTFYTGTTNNLRERIKEHKNKRSFFTKKFSQLKLVYYEKIMGKSLAAKRERQIKGWSRAKKIKLIKDNKK